MAAPSSRLWLSVDQPAPRLIGMIHALARKIDLTLLHPYHPERHYMRGPGPRWRAKQSQAQVNGRDG